MSFRRFSILVAAIALPGGALTDFTGLGNRHHFELLVGVASWVKLFQPASHNAG